MPATTSNGVVAGEAAKTLCHVITPVGMMGYGFDEPLTAHTLARLTHTGVPTAIILDSGSTDSGPQKLALGEMTCPRSSYKQDLEKLLRLVYTFDVPLIFGSAGGDGADEHVKVMQEIIQEICDDPDNKKYQFKTISLFSGIDKRIITERLKDGRLNPCGACVPALTAEDVENSPHVVAQMGPEPYIEAMQMNPDFDIIIGGRSYDPSPYVAFAIYQLQKQYPGLNTEEIEARHGGFLHMGKIMECGGQCSTPKSAGAVATIYQDGVFDVWPTAPNSSCTPISVAAHALYENTRPDILKGPGGAMHLDDVTYEQLQDGRTTRVKGCRFVSSYSEGNPYTFKLEAARIIGYRSLFMGSIKDHILLGQVEKLFPLIKTYVREQHPRIAGYWDLDFHVYGKGQTTPDGQGELFIVGEALAPTQQLANSIASKARVGMIHGPYPGQKATSGNFAFGIGGVMEIQTGPCAQFSVYHLMDLEPGEEGLMQNENLATIDRIHTNRDNSAEGVITSRARPLLRSNLSVYGNGLHGRPLPKKATANGTSPSHQPDASLAVPNNPKNLSDVSQVLRSKNAGPFEITLDAMFISKRVFDLIRESGMLTRETVAKAIGIASDEIVWLGFYEPALAFKVTIPRLRNGKRVAAGGFLENDVHGSQKHMSLAQMLLPEQLAQQVACSEG